MKAFILDRYGSADGVRSGTGWSLLVKSPNLEVDVRNVQSIRHGLG
jgi:hypothetical protein